MPKRDILELYGAAPISSEAAGRIQAGVCPFIGKKCVKVLRDDQQTTGVCTVSHGATDVPVIVCPNRLYGDNHYSLRSISQEVFPGNRVIIGGSMTEIVDKMRSRSEASVLGFGHGSGHEVQISTQTKMSFDWILQRYDENHQQSGFVAVEVQSMDTTGNYRDCLVGYRSYHRGDEVDLKQSRHGINWANVHKRLLPQLIRKGMLLSKTEGCRGMFFVLPEIVFQRFEYVLVGLSEQGEIGPDILSIRTYDPDSNTPAGILPVRSLNYRIRDIADAHYGSPDMNACIQLSNTLIHILPHSVAD